MQWALPDAVQLVQLLLLASGFQNVAALATALTNVWREIQLLVRPVSGLCVHVFSVSVLSVLCVHVCTCMRYVVCSCIFLPGSCPTSVCHP